MVEFYVAGVHEPKGLNLVKLQRKKLIDDNAVIEALKDGKVYILSPELKIMTIRASMSRMNKELNDDFKVSLQRLADTKQYVYVIESE